MNPQQAYQATFILNTREWADSKEALLAKIKEHIEELGASVGDMKELGRKPFSYVTEKSNPDGLYLQFRLQGPPETPAKLQKRFRLEKTVKRIFTESV